MSNSLLASVRRAFAPDAAEMSSFEDEPEGGATASADIHSPERANHEDAAMADQAAAGAPAATSGISQADHDAAIASARAEGRGEGVTAERERIRGIMSSEAGKANPALAAHLAYETDTSPDAAGAMLAAAGASGSASGLAEKMAQKGNPDLGTGASSGAPRSEDEKLVAFAKLRQRKA